MATISLLGGLPAIAGSLAAEGMAAAEAGALAEAIAQAETAVAVQLDADDPPLIADPARAADELKTLVSGGGISVEEAVRREIESLRARIRPRMTIRNISETFFALSHSALRGLWILLCKGVPADNLRAIFKSPHIEAFGGPERVFAHAALLYDLGVCGFAAPFSPNPKRRFNGNYFGERRNVEAQWIEHCEAACLAASPWVEDVSCNVHIETDWSRLTKAELDYLTTVLRPLLTDRMLKVFQVVREGEVDIVATPHNGRKRLIEVKSVQREIFFPQRKILLKFLLQCLGYSLICRQYDMEGVELYIDAEKVHGSVIAALREFYRMTKIPHAVVVGRGLNRQRVLGNMKPLPRVALEDILPPRRPLPEARRRF